MPAERDSRSSSQASLPEEPVWQAVPGHQRAGASGAGAAELAERRLESAQSLELLSTWVHEYAIFSLDARGAVSSWSPQAERLKGYQANEIVGRHFSVFYPPEQQTEHAPEQLLEQAAAQGSVVEENWRVRKDGSRFWAHVVITALRGADGGVRGFIKITRDDSESRARLQRASRRFADLFALTPAGIALFDHDERVVDANPALARRLGCEHQQLVGTRADDLLHPNHTSGRIVPSYSSWAEDAVTQQVLRHRDGRAIYCELQCATAEDDNGQPFYMIVFTDVTERIRHAERLRHQATHDALTGLLNHAGMVELLDDLQAAPDSGRVGLVVCDISNFKRINEALGHQAGDQLLRTLARRLEGHLPAACVPGRLGGDEFAIACSDVDQAGGIDGLATEVSSMLRTELPADGQLVRISAAIGAAVLDESITSGDELLRYADAAMYKAKRRGPGRIAIATPGENDRLSEQLALENQLSHAIKAGDLQLHYQPVVATDGSVISAEALVRWPHPEHGLLGPGAFLPLAEQADLLRDLDCWVMETALTEATSWPHSGDHPINIAVNLSGLLPTDPRFVEEVGHVLERSGIDPHRVILEVVENTLIDLPADSRRAMQNLARRGVRFAVDDFGTGYSSLARIRRLPVHILKVDREFVADLGADHTALAVAKSVIDLAHGLGHHCVAEGVETPLQFHTLTELGVHACQGWLFSRALPASDFRTLVADSPLQIPSGDSST